MPIIPFPPGAAGHPQAEHPPCTCENAALIPVLRDIVIEILGSTERLLTPEDRAAWARDPALLSLHLWPALERIQHLALTGLEEIEGEKLEQGEEP
ncbi:MAG TPA: hypothetical protein VNS22_07130 [Geminicoccus sp.]|uniref:hypothetical protein n=1 Tax=Geminicoccus sp. TaxID=2024832 RepID=UPI002BAAC399|nr:hypothetical protein [Geminicoccus sp.]HWL68144.1 hypothetical protein [Geminicoccus sp.]